MPLTGGTRMLRARRKDCNVKPNRRLDRKSSRGMLFENEELRMRTITINAEVEQGQHALKKLRRENEQLRREMWCLRDEYDKMEKLLRKRETDGEDDSNQENSESFGESDESDEERLTEVDDGRRNGKQKVEEVTTDADYRKSFESLSNVRDFDGLSVIDEQTEETQTAESLCGSSSRGNGGNRVFPVRGSEEASGGTDELPQRFGCPTPANPVKVRFGKKAGNESFPVSYDSYEPRPASPYPFDGILPIQDSYRKRYRVLERLPVSGDAAYDSNGNSNVGWMFPVPAETPDIPGIYGIRGGESVAAPEIDLVQCRTGPDVFVSDGFPGKATRESSAVTMADKMADKMADGLEAKIEGIKISQISEMDPKSDWIMTSLTKSTVSQEGEEEGGGGGGEISSRNPRETPNPEKLTIEEFAGEIDDKKFAKSIHQRSVPCQISCDRDVPGKSGNGPEETADSDIAFPTGKMAEKAFGSKYRSRLTVTLRTPPAMGKHAEAKYPAGTIPRRVPQSPQPPRFAARADASPSTRFQTFPTSGSRQTLPRTIAANAEGFLVNHYAGVRTHPNGPPASLPGSPCSGIAAKPEIGFPVSGFSSHIPADDFDENESGILPGEETLPTSASHSLIGKPVKIPPIPPPRTSSCPKSIIPAPPMSDANAMHQRIYRKGKPFQLPNSTESKFNRAIYNPLLMSRPIATSSPTISIGAAAKCGIDSSFENLFPVKFQRHNFRDESSAEDVTKEASKFREDANSFGNRKLNKSLSSPSFGSFRTIRRRHDPTGSVENIHSSAIPETGSVSAEKGNDGKRSKNRGRNNVSVSSSSGLETPMKTDRKKRRVSIQFKKKQRHREDDGKRGNGNGTGNGIPSPRGRKPKGRNDETDATASDRERTNSFSSRTSSLVTGSSSRRKFSNSSSRTYLNDDKIPWCGCWGNGCV